MTGGTEINKKRMRGKEKRESDRETSVSVLLMWLPLRWAYLLIRKINHELLRLVSSRIWANNLLIFSWRSYIIVQALWWQRKKFRINHRAVSKIKIGWIDIDPCDPGGLFFRCSAPVKSLNRLIEIFIFLLKEYFVNTGLRLTPDVNHQIYCEIKLLTLIDFAIVLMWTEWHKHLIGDKRNTVYYRMYFG